MNAKEAYAAKPWLKHYPKGVADTVDIPTISVPDLFDQVAKKYGNKTALIFYGNKISYAKLKESDRPFCYGLSRFRSKEGRHRRPLPPELPAICHRLLRGFEDRCESHPHQPRLHQP